MGISGAAGSAAGQEAPWRAPTVVEERLYAAGAEGDWPTFFTVLAGTDLYFPMSRELMDAVPGSIPFKPFHDPRFQGLSLAVFTRGMLTAPSGDHVFERSDLKALAKGWPKSVRWLAVNPGTPVETFLPADPKRWKRHTKASAPEPQLKTLWTGHRYDTLAHGMACGAMLMVNNGAIWNHLGWQWGGYTEEKELLRTWWGVSGRPEWLETTEQLLRGDVISPAWEFALRVRQALMQEHGTAPDAVRWRETAERVLVSRTAEVVDKTGRPPEFDLDADIALVQELIGRVLRYEARFRADGLLSGDSCVRSVLAWDFGRASCMARWGLGARYADLAETERALLRAGEASRQVYRSWAEFAIGFVLGRCLHFDSEEFGDWYTDMVAVHRILSTEPESPWLSVPWEQSPADVPER
ncbi:DUF1266 domain-containing protein [Streptomyces radicis]|uniref:DUF1266 domain-containing protein n=1 Tax=Streptomyces radicis TaxID=1750517 RepID=A0A3A9VU73_9ACTN|nr:DUF1266 domain-containing protein [Streptomyces radicis]RKN04329.1 DUF1266 domain-containing protein [Streptomyces radicis]RKN14836.1 DUF1266 domain-containing protein [Streptomyces radicis]